MGYKMQVIPLTQLFMDLENPRHPEKDSQVDIIEWMTSGENNVGKKLLALAKDIVTYGINPTELPSVILAGKKEYTVLEGNRRVTALKLLTNPDIAPKGWDARFKKLLPPSVPLPTSLNCVLYDDAEEAYHFIELKHLGEQDGAGVLKWGTEEQDRQSFRRRGKSKNQRALQVLDYVRSSPNFDQATKDYALGKKFPITTLERILSDSDFRAFLGLVDDGGNIHVAISETEAAKPIRKVIRDLGSKAVQVDRVKNTRLRQTYRDEFKPAEKANLTPAKNSLPLTAGGLSPTGTSTLPSKTRGAAPLQNRLVLVIPGTHLPIDQVRYSKHSQIFTELKTLQVDRKPGSTSKYYTMGVVLLFRTFLELSVNTYLVDKKVKSPRSDGAWTTDLKLETRIMSVLAALDGGSNVKLGFKKTIDKMLSHPRKPGHPNTLNDYVHSQTSRPTPADLKALWENYQKFFEVLWSELK